MNDTTRTQQKEEDRRRQEESSRQTEADIARLMAVEAGRRMVDIPKAAKGNEPLLQEYKRGLQEARKELETIPNSRVGSGVNRLERDVEREILEAQQVREAVGRERGKANEFHMHAEPGETYRGNVIGRTNSYVIQADDSRPGTIVLHERAAVSGAEKVRMNEHAEISYPHGQAGIVRNPEAAQHQRQRQMQKPGAGHERSR